MEKFAVDLDKVLDEFELNEDKSFIPDRVNNCSVEHLNGINSSKHTQFNNKPHSFDVTDSTPRYQYYEENHVPTIVPLSNSIRIENINLDDADFAPSSKTACYIPAVKTQIQNGSVDVNLVGDSSTEDSGITHCLIRDESDKKLEPSELEPDVVKVSVSAKNINFKCQSEKHNGDGNTEDRLQLALPDVMVISSGASAVKSEPDPRPELVEEVGLDMDSSSDRRFPVDDCPVEPVSFQDTEVDESKLDQYLEELENEEALSEIEAKNDVSELAVVDMLETVNENRCNNAEGALKRQINDLDGCGQNTGARPKKTLLSKENNFAKARNVNLLADCVVDKMADCEGKKSKAEVLSFFDEVSECSDVDRRFCSPKIENACDLDFTNLQQSNNGSSLRRQRPTSLNIPSRLSAGRPKQENDSLESHSFEAESSASNLTSQPPPSDKKMNNSNQTLQRPSSLLVGTPLNNLVNNVIQPPGHTPGDVLGIPDFYHQLETSSPRLDEKPKDTIASSPSISSQSGCSISNSPVDGAPQSWLPPESCEPIPSSPVTSTSTEDQQLGRVAPFWVPDSSAPVCMLCDSRFNVIKRRHHCRACGKVLCSNCCNLKAKIQYMDYKDARVCQPCSETISRVNARKAVVQTPPADISDCNANISSEVSSPSSGTPSPSMFRGRSPNPNNPEEYCSTIPPLEQAQTILDQPPPTVMVPVGVLKREGTKGKGEPKQVIFSDGIRPGGDLTELDGSPDRSIPQRKFARNLKRLTPGAGSQNKCFGQTKTKKGDVEDANELSDNTSNNSGLNNFEVEDFKSVENLIETLKDEALEPVVFAINKNLVILTKIVELDCCVNKICWCFTTKGMCNIGQAEIMVVLEFLPDETVPPPDVFRHFSFLYEEAAKGKIFNNLGHSLITETFLGSKEHGGFLFIKPSFQCLNKLILPAEPYLCGVLLQKWEAPWAKVLPMRLMLRLGAEFRYYPCPLVSVRFRKPVFCEIGHTIMNVLADFRNYQYVLPAVRGMTTVMEDKKTYINFPRNRYDEVMKALSNSNDHVLAFSTNFSMEADSHLVCVQNEEGLYQTQAINIQNKERKVTGASFVVFSGALKLSTGLSAKSSIVEDGLMVQISSDVMLALRQSMRDMQDYTIGCGPLNASDPDETVLVRWVEEDKNTNIGVRSVVDGMEMDGVQSIRIHSGTDYMGDNKLIRWTEVFLINTEGEASISRIDPINISRLSETLAQACCIALTPHLDQLKEMSINKIGLRVTINSEKVEYEVGANEERLPSCYMNNLDAELVPVIHRAASNNNEGLIVLELVFYILEQ